jgi:hypothetical protein
MQVGKPQPGEDCLWQPGALMHLQTLRTRDPDELAEGALIGWLPYQEAKLGGPAQQALLLWAEHAARLEPHGLDRLAQLLALQAVPVGRIRAPKRPVCALPSRADLVNREPSPSQAFPRQGPRGLHRAVRPHPLVRRGGG